MRCNFLDNKSKSDYQFKIIQVRHITIRINIFFLNSTTTLIFSPLQPGKSGLVCKKNGAVFQTEQCWKNSSGGLKQNVSISHVLHEDYTFPQLLTWFSKNNYFTKQWLGKPTKKSASGKTASYSSKGMQQTDKEKNPWQDEMTSSRHLKQKRWTEQRYLLILNSHLNQQALWAMERERKCYSVLHIQEEDPHMQPEDGLSRGIYKAAALWWMKTLSLSWCLSMVLD